MDLVDDVDFVFAALWRDKDLTCEFAHLVDAIVGGGVEFEDVDRGVVVERAAAVALVAGFAIGGAVFAVDGLGQDTGAGGFADATRATEEEGLGELAGEDGVLECASDVLLSDDGGKGGGTVLACGYYEIVHNTSIQYIIINRPH